MWNLATQKRLAYATQELAETIGEMVSNNAQMADEADRLSGLTNELKERNKQLRESGKLLSDKTKSMEDLEKQMTDLMDQQEEVVRTRQHHNDQLEELMELQDKNAMKEAKNILMDRVMEQFKHADKDGDFKISKGAEWDHMEEMLVTNGIQITEAFDHDGDSEITDMELEDSLGHLLEDHFAQLFSVMRQNRELQDQIDEKKRLLERKKAHL